jgi:RNA polymerase sporulation-specific sigma factor
MIAPIRDIITSPTSPTPTDLGRIASGDKQCCRKLINSWETPIYVLASRYASRSSDLDDLVQLGRIAVYQAALHYDGSLGVPFGNYTKRAIKNLILKETQRLAQQRLFDSQLEPNPEDNGADQEEIEDAAARIDSIKEWVRELPEPHASIFRLLYVEGLKQRSAAEEIGVSQPRVAQLHKAFLNLAREAFLV